jgi:serum/glucocorticoid-regulated kinase 2
LEQVMTGDAFLTHNADFNTSSPRLMQKKIQPPFKPSVESALDVANFDQEFTSETAQDSVVQDSQLSETVQDQFRGFTYNPADEHLSESVSASYGAAP